MLLWRISNHADLTGQGGLRASARWHTAGRKIVYLGLNPAICLLEHLVHLEIALEDIPASFRTLKIEVPEVIFAAAQWVGEMADDWRNDISATRAIGDHWLVHGPCLLHVPCALVPETCNVLLDSAHPDAARIVILAVIDFPFDKRLISARTG